MNDDELRAKLRDDLGSDDEVEQTLPAARRLGWRAPKPAPQDAARLLSALKTHLPGQAVIPYPALRNPRSAIRSLHFSAVLLRAQLKVVRGELWAGSALTIALGVLVTLAASQM